ncbi:MAG: hypothetical protein RIG88_07950 [Roseitalea porphyridii]
MARHPRQRWWTTCPVAAAALLLCVLVALIPATPAGAQDAPAGAAPSAAEVTLAQRYAPVVRLQERPVDGRCSEGEPYEPVDVSILFDNEEVALRGPWDRTNVVQIGPSAERLSRGLWGYHLDFPGDPLDPGCGYAEWAERISAGTPPTVYARVVSEPGFPDRIALQYWFYYVFNDWNNNHEGDWEMIQIVFPAGSAQEALGVSPEQVGYSQHSSAERAEWGDDKLELVDGTRPVVHPAAGSHANFYGERIYLMRSEAEGMGCDDAGGDHRELRPAIDVIPTARADYLVTHPWLGFDGRWGEQQSGVFNGPTGPNEKFQWTQPISWSMESWRDRSFSVPSGGLTGTRATDFFCGSVAAGSELLRRAKANPGPVGLLLAALVVLLVWSIRRTRWQPTGTRDLEAPRAWGQQVSTATLLMRERPRLFLGIGLLFIPLGLLITFLQFVLFQLTALETLLEEAGGDNAVVGSLALSIGLFFAILGLALVQAAVARAVRELVAGRPVTPLGAYRSVLGDGRVLVRALAIAVVLQVALQFSLVLLPVAIYLLVRWSLLAVVVGAEGDTGVSPLRRSAQLTRGDWLRVAVMVVGVTGAALFLGPAVGTLALILTDAAFGVVNLVAAAVYVAAVPVAALALTYLYHDLRAEEQAAASEAGHEGAPAGAITTG